MPDQESDRVKAFWDARASQPDVADAEVTHRDVWQRWLEIQMISRFLTKTDRVIDVGCGNGYTTRRIAPLVRDVLGVDFSEEMVTRAREASSGGGSQQDEAGPRYAVCDVRTLNPSSFGMFDVAISERCLINLPNWGEQRQAIENIASVLRPNGRFIFAEGCSNGRDRLNALRIKAGLEAMPSVWHNVDFDEVQLLEFLNGSFDLEHRLHFGVYDFVARVVHPLVVAPELPVYDSRINQVAAQLALDHQKFGDVSRVLFLVLRRKGATHAG